jgi:hypothetical protein
MICICWGGSVVDWRALTSVQRSIPEKRRSLLRMTSRGFVLLKAQNERNLSNHSCYDPWRLGAQSIVDRKWFMRPLSFTKNLGGFKSAYVAIKRGFTPGVTVTTFRKRCGLSSGLSLLVTEFLLGTEIQDGEEVILSDTLVTQTLCQPYTKLTARLYFFALNLNLPGERLREEHRNPAEMQNTLIRNQIHNDGGFRTSRLDKELSIEPTLESFGGFASSAALRKWVNNYHFMVEQCGFD